MYAVKANKIYTIDAADKQHFIDLGYKMADVKNNSLIFEKVETKEDREIKKLKAENEELKAKLKKKGSK